MNQHRLKTDPKHFNAVTRSGKNFEIRKDDRDFQVGDKLILMETVYTGEQMDIGYDLIFTGREIAMSVTHILRGPIYGLEEGWGGSCP